MRFCPLVLVLAATACGSSHHGPADASPPPAPVVTPAPPPAPAPPPPAPVEALLADPAAASVTVRVAPDTPNSRVNMVTPVLAAPAWTAAFSPGGTRPHYVVAETAELVAGQRFSFAVVFAKATTFTVARGRRSVFLKCAADDDQIPVGVDSFYQPGPWDLERSFPVLGLTLDPTVLRHMCKTPDHATLSFAKAPADDAPGYLVDIPVRIKL